MTKNKRPTPNDQRSNTLNPNNPAHKAARDNRANQLNPNNPAHKAARDNRANQLNPNHAPSKGGNGGGKAGSR